MGEETASEERGIKTEVEFTGHDRIWTQQGNEFRLRDNTKRLKQLELGVYTLGADIFGFYLEKEFDKFEFDHKIYGLETELVERIKRTYSSTKGNLGVLLNGVKGTGKTVTAKIICNMLGLPVVLVPSPLKNCQFFLNGIPQDIIIFIDEYEKVFKEKNDNDADMLTIMDGALNSGHRRAFVLTTNKLYVNENLIQRPGRIRYLKTFSDLAPSVIEEIVDDRLKHKKYKNEVVQFVSNLEIITVDIVNAIIDEVNIHNEAPNTFKEIFNVKKLSGKYNVYFLDEKTGDATEYKKSAQIYPRKLDENMEELVGYPFDVDGDRLGTIVEVIAKNIVRVQAAPPKKKKRSGDVVSEPSSDKKAKTKKVPIPATFIVKVEDADMMNWKYKYGNGSKNNSEYTHLM